MDESKVISKKTDYFMIAAYLLAIVAANLSVAYFGQSAVYVNAFLFIGLDLVARDRLHDAWQGKHLARNMGMLIVLGSVISYVLNRDAAQIAAASFVAFALASVVDSFTYHALRSKPMLVRVNGSNVPAALVDSVVFPTIAFGGIFVPIMIGQFLAKVAGGFFWSAIIGSTNKQSG